MKIYFKGGQWSNTEDRVLEAGIRKYGMNSWERIKSMILGKTADQCRTRWYEFLDPSIQKGPWTHTEELQLLDLVETFPNQWALISSQLDGRRPWQCHEHYDVLLFGEKDEKDSRAWDMAETKKAKVDAVNEDEYTQQLIEAARARIANSAGKKGLRKERADQLAETRFLATLQRQRELTEAGLSSKSIDKKVKKAMTEKGETSNIVAGDTDEAEEDNFVPMDLSEVAAVGNRKRRIQPKPTLLEKLPAAFQEADFNFSVGPMISEHKESIDFDMFSSLPEPVSSNEIPPISWAPREAVSHSSVQNARLEQIEAVLKESTAELPTESDIVLAHCLVDLEIDADSNKKRQRDCDDEPQRLSNRDLHAANQLIEKELFDNTWTEELHPRLASISSTTNSTTWNQQWLTAERDRVTSMVTRLQGARTVSPLEQHIKELHRKLKDESHRIVVAERQLQFYRFVETVEDKEVIRREEMLSQRVSALEELNRKTQEDFRRWKIEKISGNMKRQETIA